MIGKLYLALGVETKTLERGLRKAEREIAAYGQRMQRLGNTLTMGVTMPIIGIGTAAIRAAGEIEALDKALSTTMRDAGYTTEQAKQELDELRKIAEAPGLDFQQAVKGSLRLQSVGFSAEQARKTLAEFANGVAAAGGSAQQLDSVTVQLAQITSKGKLMNEDLMILKENMPNISKAMVDAFGTADAEGIRKLGISSEQFVIKMTEQLSGLSRVEGGISNSITNAGVSLKLFLASIGEEINKTLDIKGIVDQFSSMLGRLADWFKNLDTNQKKLIINFALVAAAAGPVIKVIGFMGTTFANTIITMTKMGQAVSVLAGKDGISKLSASWSKMNKAMQMNYIAVITLSIVALYGAIQLLTHNLETTTNAQKEFNKVQADGAANAQKEVREAEKLAGILKSETATRMEKNQALNTLKELYPSIWQGLSLEAAGIDEVNKRIGKSIKLIKLRSELRVMEAMLDEQMMRRERIRAGQDPEQEIGAIERGFLTLAAAFDKNETAADKFEKRQKELAYSLMGDVNVSIERYTDRITALEGEIKDVEGPTASFATKLKDVGGGADKSKDKLSALQKVAEKLKSELSANAEATKLYGDSVETASEKVKIIESAIDSMLKAGAKASDPDVLGLVGQQKEAQLLVDALKMVEQSRKKFSGPEPMMSVPDVQVKGGYSWSNVDNSHMIKAQENAAKLASIMTGLQDNTMSVTAAFQQLGITGNNTFELMSAIMTGTFEEVNPMISKMTEGMSALGQGVAVTAANIGSSLYSMAASGEASFAKLGHAALMMAADAVRATIMTAVTGFVKNILAGPLGKLGPIALGIASAAGAGAGALFNKLVGAVKTPKLAKGGLAFGPTMAIVGDNVGARSNPEVIAPLDKLQSMLGGAMGGEGFIASTRIDGRDLLVVLERAQKDKFRAT